MTDYNMIIRNIVALKILRAEIGHVDNRIQFSSLTFEKENKYNLVHIEY